MTGAPGKIPVFLMAHPRLSNTTTHKIIGVVGSPLYLATPVPTTLPKSHLSL